MPILRYFVAEPTRQATQIEILGFLIKGAPLSILRAANQSLKAVLRREQIITLLFRYYIKEWLWVRISVLRHFCILRSQGRTNRFISISVIRLHQITLLLLQFLPKSIPELQRVTRPQALGILEGLILHFMYYPQLIRKRSRLALLGHATHAIKRHLIVLNVCKEIQLHNIALLRRVRQRRYHWHLAVVGAGGSARGGGFHGAVVSSGAARERGIALEFLADLSLGLVPPIVTKHVLFADFSFYFLLPLLAILYRYWFAYHPYFLCLYICFLWLFGGYFFLFLFGIFRILH